MDILAILIGLLILAVSAIYILRPLRQPRRAALAANAAQSLAAQRDALYTQIKELDLDHETGKVNDEDYARLRAELVAEAAQILKQMDGVVQPDMAPVASAASDAADAEALIAARRKTRSAPAASSAADADIETAIASRRKTAPTALVCPNCSKPITASDAFCAKCGTALSVAK